MRKLSVCICTILMALMFVLFQTSTKAAPERSNPGKPTTGAFDLNGDWRANIEMQTASRNSTFSSMYKIVQKNMEIKMIAAVSEREYLGTLKGNIVNLEPGTALNSEGKKIFFPARQYKISQDGNTMTSEFDYNWERGDQKGVGSMKVTMIRE